MLVSVLYTYHVHVAQARHAAALLFIAPAIHGGQRGVAVIDVTRPVKAIGTSNSCAAPAPAVPVDVVPRWIVTAGPARAAILVPHAAPLVIVPVGASVDELLRNAAAATARVASTSACSCRLHDDAGLHHDGIQSIVKAVACVGVCGPAQLELGRLDDLPDRVRGRQAKLASDGTHLVREGRACLLQSRARARRPPQHGVYTIVDQCSHACLTNLRLRRRPSARRHRG